MHDVFSVTCNKISLSDKDGKRIIMEDKIHTFAYNHYNLNCGVKVFKKRII